MQLPTHFQERLRLYELDEGAARQLARLWPVIEPAITKAVDAFIAAEREMPSVAAVFAQHDELIRDFTLKHMCVVLSGVFDAHPKLKIILGHLGETLPFLLWRIDAALKRPGQKPLSFRDIFCRNFYVTTSGFFSNPALLCCVMEMGVDHILFAVDWPFVMNPPAVGWMQGVPLSDEDKAKILSGNAQRLLKV